MSASVWVVPFDLKPHLAGWWIESQFGAAPRRHRVRAIRSDVHRTRRWGGSHEPLAQSIESEQEQQRKHHAAAEPSARVAWTHN